MKKTIELKVGDEMRVIGGDLTIRQYQVLRELKGTDYTPSKLLSALFDIPEETINQLPAEVGKQILGLVWGEFESLDKDKVIFTFNFKGTNYGFQKNINEMNFAGFVDYELFITDGIEKNLDKLAALMYRPITSQILKSYSIEEYDSDKMIKRAEQFKDLPVKYVLSGVFFYSVVAQIYIDNMRHSLTFTRQKMIVKNLLKKKAMKLPKWMQQRVLQGIGTDRLLTLLTKILLKSKKFSKSISLRY